MASELAIIHILKNDSGIQAFCGNPARVYPMRAPQATAFPRVVVRHLGTEANDTKDGPSELDFERVQVLVQDDEWDMDTYKLSDRVRAILDHPLSGSHNGVNLESSAFEDGDQFEEQIEDKDIYVIEHIYRTMVIR